MRKEGWEETDNPHSFVLKGLPWSNPDLSWRLLRPDLLKSGGCLLALNSNIVRPMIPFQRISSPLSVCLLGHSPWHVQDQGAPDHQDDFNSVGGRHKPLEGVSLGGVQKLGQRARS